MTRSRRRSHLLTSMFDPSNPWPFMLYSVFIAIPGSGIYDLLNHIGQDLTGNIVYGKIFGTTAGIVLVFVLSFVVGMAALVRRRLVGVQFEPSVDKRYVEPRRGLIVMVSRGEVAGLAATVAIRHHYRGERDQRPTPTLQYLWLIHTSASAEAAATLKAQYEDHLTKIEPVPIDDENNSEEVFEATRRALADARRARLQPNDIIADVTGGTSSMSIGLALAAVEERLALEFLNPRSRTPDGQAVKGLRADPWLVNVGFAYDTDE